MSNDATWEGSSSTMASTYPDIVNAGGVAAFQDVHRISTRRPIAGISEPSQTGLV